MTPVVEDTSLPGVKRIVGRVHRDERGWFSELFKASAASGIGIPSQWPQDNVARSCAGVIRGLHWQLPPCAQAKLVRPLHGRILDVAVDIRRSSETFGDWVAVELAAEDGTALYVPEGFAHGYRVLGSDAVVHYKVSAEYAPTAERALRWDDPQVGIDWGPGVPILSAKDATAPGLTEADVFP